MYRVVLIVLPCDSIGKPLDLYLFDLDNAVLLESLTVNTFDYNSAWDKMVCFIQTHQTKGCILVNDTHEAQDVRVRLEHHLNIVSICMRRVELAPLFHICRPGRRTICEPDKSNFSDEIKWRAYFCDTPESHEDWCLEYILQKTNELKNKLWERHDSHLL